MQHFPRVDELRDRVSAAETGIVLIPPLLNAFLPAMALALTIVNVNFPRFPRYHYCFVFLDTD